VSYNFNIYNSISQKRYRRNLKSKRKKKAKRILINEDFIELKLILNNDYSYYNILETFLPKNLKYLLWCENSHLFIENLFFKQINTNGIFFVPVRFSLIDNPEISYDFIRIVTSALIFQQNSTIVIDYTYCNYVSLDAQIYLDIVIKDVITFFKRCRKYKRLRSNVEEIKGNNANNADVRKMLFSVGSPTIHANSSIKYDDIIPYKLCIHNSLSKSPKNINRKDVDTTLLADYVITCLARLNRKLSDEKLSDLCIVISEILINAEEHSTNNYRYSIGYFTEMNSNGDHFGIFRLVILNFGKTIYEKFKDPNCPNQNSVKKMIDLSETYNKKRFWVKKEFEEETLWTLYSLQEGITSTDPKEYKQRGNGSIRFIESFFNIKGTKQIEDNISKMTLMSGNSKIVFDGTYNIVSDIKHGEKFQYMTFNESGNIMNKPDSKFVSFVENYFPGTIISAEILFNEDDLEYGN
jgi:hypothetical protein